MAETAAPPSGVSAERPTFSEVRAFSRRLCEPLEIEDYVVQSMPDTSPTRWHLAHTTWFFETFVLERFCTDYTPVNPDYRQVFNSYYNTVGEQFPRPRRGVLSRPTVAQILDYRRQVDERVMALLAEASGDAERSAAIQSIIEVGLHHEQQHQELILTDIKHVFGCNPLNPVYSPVAPAPAAAEQGPLTWHGFAGGTVAIGFDGDGFCYDNERPRHDVLVPAFEMSDRLVTNAEYLQFVLDGAYDRHELWLSDGWNTVLNERWRAPLYWRQVDGLWHEFTLCGLQPLQPGRPVTHVSYYEADAYARWAEALLPTEAAWEVAAEAADANGAFAEDAEFHPRAANNTQTAAPRQLLGDAWEWTASPYMAYPGYRPPDGALGEYNAKFMCNQMILRGGSCATPRQHIRRTYRNFFSPAARWQFSSIRLTRLAS